MSKSTFLKTSLLALGTFAATSQEIAAQEKSPIVKDSLNVTCVCAKEKLASVKMLYQDNGQLSAFRHTTATGGATIFKDAIVKKITGIKSRKGTEKQSFNTNKNNLPEETLEILELIVKNGEETCKTEADAKANSEKTILINAGKYPINLSKEDKNKTINWFKAIRL